MILNLRWTSFALLMIGVAVAAAQTPTLPTTPVTETAAPADSHFVTLKQGTEVHLKLGQRLSAKTSSVNAPVELVLDEDLKAGEVLVASKGARVIGRVTEGKKDCENGPCGWRDKRQPGKQVSIRLEYAVTPYGKVQMVGEEHGKTHRNTGAIVASTAAFGLTGFFISWNASAKNVLEENAPLVATVAADFDVPIPPAPAN
jgi:hypothetical protein